MTGDGARSLDGAHAPDDARLAAYEANEAGFDTIDPQARRRLEDASQRALRKALGATGLDAAEPDEDAAPVPMPRKVTERPGVLDRILAWIKSPAMLVTVAAVVVAVFVTSRLGKADEDPLGFSGSEDARRVVLRCRPGALARTEATPRVTTTWCDKDGKKDGWSLVLAADRPPELTCWRAGERVPATECGP